jgi:hypothetical protein
VQRPIAKPQFITTSMILGALKAQSKYPFFWGLAIQMGGSKKIAAGSDLLTNETSNKELSDFCLINMLICRLMSEFCMFATVFVGNLYDCFLDPLYLYLISVPNKGATHSGFERLK